MVSPGPSLLEAEQLQLSQPFLIGEVLQPRIIFVAPFLLINPENPWKCQFLIDPTIH